MKRSIGLAFAALAIVASPTLVVSAATTNSATTTAATTSIPSISINNAPQKGSALGNPQALLQNHETASSSAGLSSSAGSVASSSQINITSATVNGNSITLTGTVTDGSGATTPFNLQGTLGSGNNAGDILGNLTDQTGNFQVLRFEVSNNPERDMFYSSAAQSSNVPYAALYLKQTGTRNITFAEAPASTLLGSSNASTVESGTYSLAPMQDRVWMENMVQPERMQKQEVNQWVTNSPSTSSASSGAMVATPASGTFTSPTVHNQESYTVYYEIFGYDVDDTITIQENTTEPAGPGTADGQLCVAGWDWNEYQLNGTHIQDLKNTMTNWEIGVHNISSKSGYPGTAGISFETAAPDGINQIDGSAKWTSSNGYGIQWGLSYSIPYTPISATLVWPSIGEQQTTSNQANMGFEPGNNAGDASWYLNGNGSNYLQSISQNPSTSPNGDQLNAGFLMDIKSSGSQTSGTYTLEYLYDLQSGPQNNTTDWGEEIDPYSWTANPTA